LKNKIYNRYFTLFLLLKAKSKIITFVSRIITLINVIFAPKKGSAKKKW